MALPNSGPWTIPIRSATATSASATEFDECRALYLGTAGDVTVTFYGGATATFKNLVAGVFHPIACIAVTTLANGAADCYRGY